MSEIPSLYVVRAAIPNAEKPNLHILDQEGRYPSAASGEKSLSIEQMLHEIGSKAVIGAALSIDRQKERGNVRSNGSIVNIADVITKPIDPNAIKLFDGYSWREGYL